MGDHDRSGGDRPRGDDCEGGVGPTSTLQTFLERSFRVTAGGGKSREAGGGEIVEGAMKDRRTVVHAYSGNEACDADSICSAIVMAFLQDCLASVIEGGGDDLLPRVQHVPGTGEDTYRGVSFGALANCTDALTICLNPSG